MFQIHTIAFEHYWETYFHSICKVEYLIHITQLWSPWLTAHLMMVWEYQYQLTQNQLLQSFLKGISFSKKFLFIPLRASKTITSKEFIKFDRKWFVSITVLLGKGCLSWLKAVSKSIPALILLLVKESLNFKECPTF